MPRTSLHSVRHDAVPKDRVLTAARAWAQQLRHDHPELVRVGYFGSYARGDYVPGSDLDVLIELRRSKEARWRDRGPAYRPERFPVGLDVFAYTSDELAEMRTAKAAFIRTIDAEIQWLA